MIHLKTILHPTDFSANSHYALELACAMAREQEARVILLHIVPRPISIGRDSQVPAFKEAHAEVDILTDRWEMSDQLEKLRVKAPCPRVETLIKEGNVADTIVRAAHETACDLIVMGTYGRSRAYQAVMGSIAAEVTRNASCPVVTVKVPLPQS